MINYVIPLCGIRFGWLQRINRLFLIVKTTVLFLTVGCLHISAASLSQTISIKARKWPLSQVLDVIRQQTNYQVIYNDQLVNPNVEVNLTANRMPVEAFLEKLLKPLSLSYRVKENTILIGAAADDPPFSRKLTSQIGQPTAQQRTITGRVTDSQHNPLIGANVRIKGTNNVVVTDDRGNYSIKVGDGDTLLVFSYVGFRAVERKTEGNNVLNVALSPHEDALNEVVVVGYGEIRKSDLTGSVSSITVKEVNERPISSVEQMIQGQASGVQITQNTGAPGGGITFNIRGATSISGSNQPLIVIDGYPVDSDNAAVKMDDGSQSGYLSDIPQDNALASLNPADIASIEILKDASSTAIYGSRGANGVVLITTKRGKEGRDRIEYNFRTDFSNIPKKIDLLNTRDYLNYANEGYVNSGRDSLYPPDQMEEYLKTDIDWQSLIFRTAVNQNHQASISGGNGKMKYSAVLGYLGQEGIVENSKFDRGSIRLNLDREVNTRFNMGISINGSLSNNKAAMQASSRDDISTSIIHGALRSRPLVSPYTAEDELDDSYIGNPLTLVTLADDNNRITTVVTNLFAIYSILPDLNFKVNGGVNSVISQRDFYHPRGTTLGNLSGGYAYRGNTNAFNYLTEYTLNFNRTINKRHRINAVAGYTWQEWKRNSFGINALGFPNDSQLYYNLGSASTISKPTTNTTQWALASFLSRVNYSYDGKYLLTLTGRADGSTRLAEGNKWDFFPSIAAGWNIHKESFLKQVDFLSEFKFRSSYGVSGNQSIAVGGTRANMNTTNSVINQTIQTGFIQSNMANSSLHWERTSQVNIGADIGFLKNRLNLVFEYYNKRTEELLISLVIPPSNSFTRYNTNSGTIENKGFEFDVNAQILTRSFKWDVSGNFSVNKNKIISLGSIESFPAPAYGTVGGQSLNIAKVGYPIGAFYGYRIIGIYQNQEEIDAGPTDPTLPVPGDFKFKDINGDGKISAEDREFIGDPRPDFIFGFNNNFSWKGFSLSAFVMGSIGQDVINSNRYYLDALSMNFQSNVRQVAYDNRWRGEGTSNTYPRANAQTQAFKSRFSDFIVEDASFIRLKNVVLSYSFSKKNIPFLENVKVFASATNLITITNYSGFDPEVNSRGDNSLTIGIDGGSIPQYRTFSFGLGVGF